MSMPTARRFPSPRFCLNLAVAASLGVVAADHVIAQPGNPETLQDRRATLVVLVRDATRPFIDVNQAIAAGYGPFLGCVSGPEEGAMGIHYVNGALVADGILDPAQPEALMYEISGNRARLLGVEFIVDAATWLAQNNNVPPVLEGQSFQYVSSPNRYALPAFYELHVWAWQDNPKGTFVDWNPRVRCDRQ
jgi:hypothetical protein